MKKLASILAVLVLFAVAAPAQDPNLAARVKHLEQRVQELEAQLQKVTAAQTAAPAVTTAASAAPAASTGAPVPATPAMSGAQADAPAEAPAAPTGSGWAWAAYIDAYYGYNLNHPASRLTQLRNFDTNTNQFALNFGKITLEHSADPVGFRIDLGYGQALDIVHASEPAGKSLFNNFEQAYVSYKAPIGKGLQLDFGKMVTPLGAEVIESKDNYNYSRSLLFAYAIPYYHFGLRASYPVTPSVTVTGIMVNGWNNVQDNNTGKTYDGGVSWTVNKHLAISQNVITGPESTDSNRGYRTVSDTVVTVTANSKLTLLGNYDYGHDRPYGLNTVHWTGLAGAARYQLSGRWAIAPRLEWFSDPDGFATGAVQRVKEGTMTLEYKLHEGMISRFEYRHDWSNQPFFDRNGNPASSKTQNTLAAAVLFYFASAR